MVVASAVTNDMATAKLFLEKENNQMLLIGEEKLLRLPLLSLKIQLLIRRHTH
jgi:ribose 5-phosphate isomerase RpiB